MQISDCKSIVTLVHLNCQQKRRRKKGAGSCFYQEPLRTKLMLPISEMYKRELISILRILFILFHILGSTHLEMNPLFNYFARLKGVMRSSRNCTKYLQNA